MSHAQLFLPVDSEEGYVSAIVHRERYIPAFLAMGWKETAAEALAAKVAKPVEPVVPVVIVEPEPIEPEPEIVAAPVVAEEAPAEPRKKLGLKK